MNSEQQYIKGFNHGYMLTKHLPDLVTKLIKNLQTTTEYLSGFFSGKEEYELEVNRVHLAEIQSLREKGKDRERDLEQ